MRTLNRAERRQLQALTDTIDQTAVESDRRFFNRHRGRHYRVRRASMAELEAGKLAVGATAIPEPGLAAFVAVRLFADGVRARAFFSGPADNETDMPEWQARWLYHREVDRNPAVAAVNRQLEETSELLRREALDSFHDGEDRDHGRHHPDRDDPEGRAR